jgi:lipopolysaccharide assembly outer membrane protein LptD (OstA)
MLSDNRAGVGVKAKINDRVTATAEVSDGDQGPDVTATVEYAPTKDDRYTIGYRRDAYRASLPGTSYVLSGTDLGVVTGGAHHKFNDQWSAFTEDSFDWYGARQTLTDAYGITYTPVPDWTFEADAQLGRVFDNTINPATSLKNPNLYRDALSLSAVYHNKDKGLDGKLKGEMRWDMADDGSSNVLAYLIQFGAGAKMSKDWRALASLDAVWSTSSDSTKESTYLNGVVGFAYRPADNDRLNALVKYNYVYDAPGAGQVTLDGTTTSPMQQSHIFSGDVTYNITPKLALGGKYGFRIGQLLDRTIPGAAWQASSAHLAILRADYHIVNEWDVLAEARALWSPTDGTTDYGFVAALYRQIGPNFRLGLGYNFGDFSDDLAHISHDNHGVFVNLVGSF